MSEFLSELLMILLIILLLPFEIIIAIIKGLCAMFKELADYLSLLR